MDLDELKALWKEENQQLEARLRVREETIRNMNLENATGRFDELLTMSVLGRNLALVYGIVSLIFAWQVIPEIEYSMPAVVGSLAMFWSFWYHLSIKKPDYFAISIVELQKSIANFRVYSASSAKYDISVVAIWLLTLVPVVLRTIFDISIYGNTKSLSVFCFVAFIGMISLIAISRKMYKDLDQKLKELEIHIIELVEFEKEYKNPTEMKTLKNNSQTLPFLIGIYTFGALVFISIAGYHFGVWLKGWLG